MSGRMGKNKGAGGERELAKLLQDWLGLDIERALGQARDGGADITCIPGLCIEVKRQEQLNLGKWWKQVTTAARPEEVPILAYRQNRRRWTFCLPFYLLCKGAGSWNWLQLDEAEFHLWLIAYMEKQDAV